MTPFMQNMIYFRVTKGLPQSEVARRIEMDKSSVSRFESGEREPTRDQVILLAAAMELDPDETDTLLISANYLPVSGGSLLADERLRKLNDIIPMLPGDVQWAVGERLDDILTDVQKGLSLAPAG